MKKYILLAAIALTLATSGAGWAQDQGSANANGQQQNGATGNTTTNGQASGGAATQGQPAGQ